jgi:hypothetical protein
MMHMQLGHYIADGGNIQLIPLKQLSHSFSQSTGLLQQLLAIRLIQLIDLANIGSPGHQNNPGIIGIFAQQHQT